MANVRRPLGAITELQRLRAHARQLILSKRHDLAEGILRQILAILPNDPRATQQLAGCLLQLRRIDEALQQAKIAVALDPTSIAALTTLAAIHMGFKHFDEAITTYAQVLQIDPNYIPAWSGLASTYSLTANWERALEVAEKGLAIQADHAKLLRTRGEALAALGRNEDAVRAMYEFLQIAPNDPESHRTAGSILKRLDQTEDAAEFVQRALRMDPANPYLHNFLAQLNLKTRRFEHADRHFKEAAEIYESRPDGRKGDQEIEVISLMGQAVVNLRKRLFQTAETQYRRVLEIQPDHSRAPALLAATIGMQNRFDEALPMVREAVSRRPELLQPRVLLAALLADVEQNDEALALAQEALETHPTSIQPSRVLAAIHINLEDFPTALREIETALATNQEPYTRRVWATVIAGLGRRDEAIQIIEAGLRDEPDDYNWHERAGRVFHLLRQYEQAETHYRRAMELDPSGLGCHGWLGLVYFDQGRIAEAHPLLEKSNSLNPHQRRIRAALSAICKN